MNLIKIYHLLPFFVKNIAATYYGYRQDVSRNYQSVEFKKLISERENWTFEQYRNWQKDAIREILAYSVKKVPYYREWWRDKDQSKIFDISNWPILEKNIVRNQPHLFISEDYEIKELTVMHTSGTTGKPMTIYLSKESIGMWYTLYSLRIKKANGIDPDKDPFGTFAGQLVCSKEEKSPPFWIHNRYNNQLYFSSYHLSSKNIKYYVEALFKYNLTYLMGYTSSIFNLAQLAIQENLDLPRLKLIITNAEPLYDHQRELLSRAFNCPIVQTYSGCEYAFGGSEDLSRNMWLWPESGLLEVINSNGEIKRFGSGEFLATGLVNRAMPLIRYRIGDSGEIAKSEEIPSGANKLFLKRIEGRTDDLIKTPAGELIGRLDTVFKAGFNIMEAQIIQTRIDSIELRVVETEGFTVDQKKELIQRLQDRVGKSMNINYESVDIIPRGANGKFKAVASNIAL